MLELRALTDWLDAPGRARDVRDALRACVADVAEGGPSQESRRGAPDPGVTMTET